ncbi:MAG: DUF1549 domain-containing protein [Pirellulales bacterium]
MLTAALFCLAAACGADAGPVPAAERPAVFPAALEVTRRIDELAQQHWTATGTQTAESCDDATFLRRVTIDLAGRVPSYREATEFAADATSDKRQRAIARLIDSREFDLHLGELLDDFIQGKYAGDREFIGYLRKSLKEGRAWDSLFAQLLLGPFDTPEQQVASRFLSKRIRVLDELTNDTARVFFGVDISCAKCHDHPLVDDWKQHHYYGMVGFLSRLQPAKDNKPPVIIEKDVGEVSFVDTSGTQHKAAIMFLGGQVVEDARLGLDPRVVERRQEAEAAGRYEPPVFSPREELVRLAIEEQKFLSKSLANRLWAYLLGRGLVHPVEQMHSQNPSSIPDLVEFLGADLAGHHYDVRRLVAGIVSSQAYQLSSEWTSQAEPPAPEHFARATIKPLTPIEYARSAVLVAGDEGYDMAADDAAREQRYLGAEGAAYGRAEPLDRRRDGFQSSSVEALFMSNDPRIQELAAANGNNLAGRLAGITDDNELLNKAYWTVLSRAPSDDERTELSAFLARAGEERKGACSQLVWALFTSAEFRFNH